MRRRIDRIIRILIVLNVVAVTSLLAVVVAAAFLGGIRPGFPAQFATPNPSRTPDLVEMGVAHIPTTASCLLCHEGGGSGKVKPVPPLGHQVAGWERCLVCHTNDSLARTAPGHDGIPENECLSCHKSAPDGPPITQAHAQLAQPCLACHGDVAHLPSTMVGRDPDQCWLCHQPAPTTAPQRPHPPVEGKGCRACHQASDVGALPMDHAFRSNDSCVLCHAIGDGASGLRWPSAEAVPAGSDPARVLVPLRWPGG